MKLIAISILAAVLTLPWIINAATFAGCDFESNYKCEVIHGIGVFVPPAAFITVWFDGDE